jgi:hypothetical protein
VGARVATAPDVPAALAGYEHERRDKTSFARIEEVLSERDLAAIGDAYRHTGSIDVAELNTRRSWSPAGGPEPMTVRCSFQ